MNPDPAAADPMAGPLTATRTDEATASPPPNSRVRWMRWIIAGNPFYPLSAVLVLLGIFQLSGSDRIFVSELGQLLFNFGALEAYGFLIAGTAVFLYRRAIHYDTLMLVVLAMLPVLVPFILISQGALLGGVATMSILCALSAGLGLAQYQLLRRAIRELPLSTGLTWFLCGLLLVNLALPVLLKSLHARLNAIDWAVQQDRYWPLGWMLLMPVLVLGGFAPPRPPGSRFGDCRAGWLTTMLTGLLVAGTGAHLLSLGHVYSFPWRPTYAYPACWLFAWLIWYRRGEWRAGVTGRWPGFAIALPAFSSVVAALQPGSATLLAINLANLAAYGALALADKPRLLPRALALASAAGVILSLPVDSIQRFTPVATRPELLWLAASALAFGVSWFQKRPRWAVIAGLSVIAPLKYCWLDATDDRPLIGQLAIIVCWLQSLRLHPGGSRLAKAMPPVAFSVWMLHALAWLLHNGGVGRLSLPVLAIAVAAVAGGIGWIRRQWMDGLFSGLALLIAVLSGAGGVLPLARRVSVGLWVLLAGLICFTAGTVSAIWRKRWRSN